MRGWISKNVPQGHFLWGATNKMKILCPLGIAIHLGGFYDTIK